MSQQQLVDDSAAAAQLETKEGVWDAAEGVLQR